MTNARFSILQARAVSDARISNSQFRTLAALGMYGDKDGYCWPKLATLSEILGKSKQAISRDMQALAEFGYIEIEHQFREDGSQMHNRYRLLFDSVPHQRSVDPHQQGVYPPSTPEVDPPSTSEVDALTPHINDPIEYIEEGEAPAFIAMRDMLSEVTGCPPTPGDIKGIEDCVKLGVIREDAEAALQWRKDNLRPAVKTISQLIPGIKTNYSMRVQNSNAKPARAGKMSKLEARRRELQDGN